MAHDIFLKINGIDGESKDATHQNEIEVLSWSWNVSQQSNMHRAVAQARLRWTICNSSISSTGRART